MASKLPKDAKDLIPYCEDQGIPNLAGAYARGVSVQHDIYVAGAGADPYVFADEGLSDMADVAYVVIAMNQTAVARPMTATSKAVTGFTLTGQNAADVVDLIIVGRLKGQAS